MASSGPAGRCPQAVRPSVYRPGSNHVSTLFDSGNVNAVHRAAVETANDNVLRDMSPSQITASAVRGVSPACDESKSVIRERSAMGWWLMIDKSIEVAERIVHETCAYRPLSDLPALPLALSRHNRIG